MSDLIRWNDPFAGLTSMHSQLDDLFNNFFATTPAAQRSMPAMDIYSEDDKQLVAEVHAPGYNREDVEVNVHNGVLEIKGEHKDKEETKKKRNYMMRESHNSFYRRIALPKYADGEAVQASFQDGVLKVTVPFKELPQPKRISISAGKK